MVDPSMEELVEKAEETAHQVFSKVDADDNGHMTEDEFVVACLNDESLYKLLASGGDMNQQPKL
jgi:Ca2+-binding EF-hand superfamily protein